MSKKEMVRHLCSIIQNGTSHEVNNASEELITIYKPYIIETVSLFIDPLDMDFDDIIQEGYLLLLEYAKNYNLSYDIDFSSYLTVHHFSNNLKTKVINMLKFSGIRYPTRWYDRYYKIKKKDMDPDDVMLKFSHKFPGNSTTNYQDSLAFARMYEEGFIYLDELNDVDDIYEYGVNYEYEKYTFDEEIDRIILFEVIDKIMKKVLTERERLVISSKFSDENISDEYIASKILNNMCTAGRVYQIRHNALRKLRTSRYEPILREFMFSDYLCTNKWKISKINESLEIENKAKEEVNKDARLIIADSIIKKKQSKSAKRFYDKKLRKEEDEYIFTDKFTESVKEFLAEGFLERYKNSTKTKIVDLKDFSIHGLEKIVQKLTKDVCDYKSTYTILTYLHHQLKSLDFFLSGFNNGNTLRFMCKGEKEVYYIIDFKIKNGVYSSISIISKEDNKCIYEREL